MASTSTASYGDCVAALRTSLSFLESSVNTLDNGVSDFPRLVSVLKTARVRYFPLILSLTIPYLTLSHPVLPSLLPRAHHLQPNTPVALTPRPNQTISANPTTQHTQHYELIPQTTLQTAEDSLRSELSPAITTLLDRADAHIDRVDRRIESLRARAELQQGRLDDTRPTTSSRTNPNPKSKNKASGMGSSSDNALDGSAQLRARVLKQRREALQYSVVRLELEVLQKERELRKRLDVPP